MHRFRWLSILGVSCSFGIAACSDDSGGVPNPPDAMAGPDAPAGDAGPGVDGPTIDAGPRPDGPPPVTGGIIISELVLFPQRDWSRSEGGGGSFTGVPGTGTVTAGLDQYIEIQNTGSTPVDLNGWSIAVVDTSDGEETITPLASLNGATLTLGGNSEDGVLNPGDFAILGNPQGTIATDALILLRDHRSVVVDDVEIGLDDFEDDGDDGAPGPGENGFSHGEFDEAIARPDGAPDTNDDRVDFVKMYATPLQPNVPPLPSPGDTTPPRAEAPDNSDNWPVTQPVVIEFNEKLNGADLGPEHFELRVNGALRPIQRITFVLKSNDAKPQLETAGVLPFGATVEVTVAPTVKDSAGNEMGEEAIITFTTEAAPPNNASVILNEICTAQQHDWNRSDPNDNGTPFTNNPGTNPSARSSSDEWIELQVAANLPGNIDLTDYTIEVFNGPNLEGPSLLVTTLDDGKVEDEEIQFQGNSTLTSVIPGERVVVGNPTGSMENDIYVVLRDSQGVILDEVEIGGNTEATDRGGDGIEGAGAGAPDVGLNGRSTGVADETIYRIRDGSGAPVDTGNDAADWAQGMATILNPN